MKKIKTLTLNRQSIILLTNDRQLVVKGGDPGPNGTIFTDCLFVTLLGCQGHTKKNCGGGTGGGSANSGVKICKYTV